MIDDQVVLTAERLRDDLAELRSALRKKYKDPKRQVVADDLRAEAAQLAETWMVDLVGRSEVANAIASDPLADLNVRFQRLLTLSEHASKRSRYDSEIKAILDGFTLEVVIPLKRLRNEPAGPSRMGDGGAIRSVEFVPTAFVAHSFSPSDKDVVVAVRHTLEALGIRVATGQKPKAESISEKVKRLIEGQYLFIGVFTRRDKIARKNEWTTSPWLIDEKAYAVGKQKKLILLREQGVGSIGGIQGDYEFIEFTRDRLGELVVQLVEVFDVAARGLRT